MKFTIDDLDSKLFQLESGLIAADHPHIYMQWLQIKMTNKILEEMKEVKNALKELNTELSK